MKKNKHNIEEEINSFLEFWDCKQMVDFLQKLSPLLELYDVYDEDDWIMLKVGEENTDNVRLIQTVYLISKLAESYSSVFCKIKITYPKLWKRMEKHIEDLNIMVD